MFEKATKAKSYLRASVFGPSGAGKTFSSLRIAKGLVEGETGMKAEIALIDTERASASKYSDRFDFWTVELGSHDIEQYCAAIEAAGKAGFGCLVIDSLTHAWQQLLNDVEKLAQAKYRGNTWSAWSEGTPMQKRLVNALLDFPGHIIATMRTKTAWEVSDAGGGKSRPIRVGLAPEQGKGIEYEFDLLMEITVDHTARVIKDRSGKFQDAIIEKPGEQFGSELRAWLRDDALPDEATKLEDVPRDCPHVAALVNAIESHEIEDSKVSAWCMHFKVEHINDLTESQVDSILKKVEETMTNG